MNSVSTKVPLWKTDCESFQRAKLPFELKDVEKEHGTFVIEFAAKYNLKYVRKGKCILFTPKAARKPKK